MEDDKDIIFEELKEKYNKKKVELIGYKGKQGYVIGIRQYIYNGSLNYKYQLEVSFEDGSGSEWIDVEDIELVENNKNEISEINLLHMFRIYDNEYLRIIKGKHKEKIGFLITMERNIIDKEPKYSAEIKIVDTNEVITIPIENIKIINILGKRVKVIDDDFEGIVINKNREYIAIKNEEGKIITNILIKDIKLINNEKEIEKMIKIGEEVEIINGDFKGLKGKYLGNSLYTSNMKLVRINNQNSIVVSLNDIKPIVPKIKDETFRRYIKNKDFTEEFYTYIEIRGRKTTVTLLDYYVEGTVCCSKEDVWNKEEGIERAFKKALANKLLKEAKEDKNKEKPVLVG